APRAVRAEPESRVRRMRILRGNLPVTLCLYSWAPASPPRSDRADCRAYVSTWLLPKGMIEGHGWNPRVVQSSARQRMHDIRAHQPGRSEVPSHSGHSDDTRDCLVRAGEANGFNIHQGRVRRNGLSEAANASETMADQLANQR